MKHVFLPLSIALVVLLVALPAQGQNQVREGTLLPGGVNPGWVEPPSWFRETFLDIREDIEDAAAEGRNLMIYLYQDGCPYCERLIRDNFAQQDIAEKTQKYFDVVAINMWGAREVTNLDGEDVTEADFARSLKVQYTPTLLMLDETGDVLARINGYFPPHRFRVALEYIGEGHHTDMTFPEYLAKVGEEPASGKLHVRDEWMTPPVDLSEVINGSDKPLLVFFEQEQCSACDELHTDILVREESEELLKQFNVAHVDIWSRDKLTTPAGETMEAREWARDMNVLFTPTMVFIHPEDGEVIRTEGYFRTFHVQGVMHYVLSGAYREQPELQRYLDDRAYELRDQGIEVDLMD
ncbi:thioredoxin [Thioalkalivibrio denitrificans]|uniref:Thioredoxin n=1 Tax=Thioalkalivibrio denitrificans TaxID=108003 RepID=A0A1V3NQL1_9GAMM|nr:thioredoxin fold domain-containing protein [Thioalkalivibrio denitrificans]OOG27112.1 thioredoxin [Thioalkalivibrio denitrificans]